MFKFVYSPSLDLPVCTESKCGYAVEISNVRPHLFVVAKGSSMGTGQILYAALLQFSRVLRSASQHCLEQIQFAAFKWVGLPSSSIPHEYDDILQASVVSDLHSFASIYGLSMAYKKLVRDRGMPLPPARMIKPTLLVYWNSLKGGVDEYSRAMKSLTQNNTSENPILNIIGRILCSQVNNAAIVHRPAVARSKGLLPNCFETSNTRGSGYTKLRHGITQCETFGAFARGLAAEVNDYYMLLSGRKTSQNACSPVLSVTERMAVKPFYCSEAAKKYNRTTDKARRFISTPIHRSVKGEATYCSLCSYTYVFKYRGKRHTKKSGSRERKWCIICRQAICTKRWEVWHSEDTLVCDSITEAEKDAFQDAVRAKHNN